MLSIFRRGLTSKIMLVILAIGLFAIVVTGFGTPGGSVGGLGGGDTLASIEGEAVTSTEISDQVNRQLSRARQQQPELDISAFLRGGAFEEILTQLISSKAMLVFGREQGLAASKRMIDGEIASIPAFQNLAGQFDQQAFRAALSRENVTEQQLRQELATTLIQRQMLLPVAGSAKVPQAMALQYASLLLEQRSGSVGIVPADAIGPGAQPTDAEVAAFFQQNPGRYTIPERRVLRYASFGTEQVAGAAQPTEAEIAQYYQANQDRYGAKETRTLSQVVLPDQAAARAFAQRLAGGASFAQAAQAEGFSAADIAVGQQTRAQFTELTSEQVAAAAFAAAQGATTQPLQSPLGWHVVKVEGVTSSQATPLATVRPEIVNAISRRKQEEALGTMVTRIEDALGGGSSFEEVAKAEKLTILETPPITGAGVQYDNPNWKAPELAPVLKTAFEMAPDEDPVVETLVPGQRFAILAIGRVVPAAPPPLATIKDRVRADVVRRRAVERAKAVANQIVARINAGTAPAQAFAAANVTLPPVQSVTARRLDIARPNQPVPPPLAMLFSLPKGRAKILAAPNGQGWFVVHLATTTPGNAATSPGLIEATKTQFERIMGEEYAAQFTRAVERNLDIERNDDAIRAAKAQLQRGTVAAQ